MMRRHLAYPVYLALLMTVALAACRRESLPIPEDAIRFSVGPTVSVSSTLTKAGDDPTAEDYLVKHGNVVRVWGDYTTNGGTSWTSPFPGTDITCAWAVGGTPSWNYTPVQSWVDNATYRFRAVFPTSANIQTGAGQTSGDKLVVQYTNSKTDENYDLMVASAPSLSSATQIGTTLPLTFRHACAAVRFLFQKNVADQNDYVIKEFRLENLYKQETLIYTGASATAGVTTAEWSHNGPRAQIYADNTINWAVPSDKANFDGFPTGYKWFFMIPQPLAVNDGLKPSVYIKYQSDAAPIESTIELPTTDSFEAGKKYTYVINILSKETGITLSIEPWDVVDVPVDDIIFEAP